jgi:hypothetical protein
MYFVIHSTVDTAADTVEDTAADTAADTVEDTAADTAADTVEDTAVDTLLYMVFEEQVYNMTVPYLSCYVTLEVEELRLCLENS